MAMFSVYISDVVYCRMASASMGLPVVIAVSCGGDMDKRRCINCVYAVRLLDRFFRIALHRWPGLLACLNHPDCPGRMVGVPYVSTCRNFRGRGERKRRAPVPDPPDDQSRLIPLTQGKFAIVDAADYDWLSGYRWFVMESRRGGQTYAATSIRGKTIPMHRLIMNPPAGKVVDHFDGNGLNNRRSNLRICDPEQNRFNLKPRKIEGKTSRFIGVYRDKRYPDKWYGSVQCHRKVTHLGPFTSEIEAARARDREAIKQHGPYARLNFPGLAQRYQSAAQSRHA
jgi:hypothetical protein